MPGQESRLSTPKDSVEVRMEQLLFPWQSSSTVLSTSLMLQEKPYNEDLINLGPVSGC